MSESPEGVAIVGQGAIGNLRELQALLEGLGIASRLMAPPREHQSG